MNVQLAGFGIVESEWCCFCSEQLETFILFLVYRFVDCFRYNIADGFP